MAFAKISQVAHYAPAQVVTNDDLSKIMDTSDEWIRTRTGIQERRISLTENTSDLATHVAQQLLYKRGFIISGVVSLTTGNSLQDRKSVV